MKKNEVPATGSMGWKMTIDKAITTFYKGLDDIKGRVHVARKRSRNKTQGFPVGCHVHDHWEMKAALKGRFLFEMPGYSEYISSGHVLLIPPHTIHVAYRFGSELMGTDSSYFYMAHRRHNQCEIGIQYRTRFIFYSLSEAEWMRFNEMISFSPPALFDRLILKDRHPIEFESYHLSLLQMIFSSLHAILAEEEKPDSNRMDLTLHKTLGFIERRFHHRDISLDSVARESGISPTYLNHMFKTKYGKSIWQMIVDLRLEMAAKLLGQKKYCVKDVAHFSGWSNPFYFSNVFSKKYGVPPSLF